MSVPRAESLNAAAHDYARRGWRVLPLHHVYDLDLQRFLFLDGGYITQAKIRSASGEPDLVGGLDTGDPLVCEGKLFTAEHRKSRIAEGFHQVIKYANDYGKNVAYLVVFNLTDCLLKFPADGPSER